MLAVAVLAAILKPVTLQLPALSVKKALVAITEQTGVPLSAQGRIAGEVVLVDVHDRPLEKVLQDLAYVLHSEVHPLDNGFRITRPKETQSELEQRETRLRVENLQRLLDTKAKQLSSAPGPTARAEQMVAALKKQEDHIKEQRASGNIASLNLDEVRRESPAGRLASQLAILLGAKEAASLGEFENVTYSNLPVKGQKAFPPEAKALIDEYAETEQSLAMLLDDSLVNGQAAQHYQDLFESARMPDGVGKICLGISRTTNQFSFGIEVFTRAGKLRSNAFVDTTAMGQPTAYEAAANLKSAKPKVVPLPPLRAEFQRLCPSDPNVMRTVREDASGEKMSAELRELISHPEDVDPLDLFGGQTLNLLARLKRTEIVACVTEGLPMAERTAILPEGIDMSRYEAGLEQICGLEGDTDNGIWRLRPKYPVAAEEGRLSRAALARYLQAYLREGRESLAILARLHFETGWQLFTSMLYRSEQLLLERQGFASFPRRSSIDPALLRFLGSLDPKVLTAPTADLELGSLTTVQRSLLLDWVRGMDLAGRDATDLSDLDHRVVEAFRGQDPPGRVQLTFVEQPGAQLASVNSEMPMEDPLRDADSLGKLFAYWTKTSQWQFGTGLESTRFLTGISQTLNIRFLIGPNLFVGDRIEAGRCADDAKPMSFDELPAEFRKAVRDAYERERKRDSLP